MEIQPIVIGTAGHIDHGKSTLVRALTGIDPDRLKEEKERGLTIDLGFAPLEMPDGRKVGLVDVPGHERFIKNMVAGASGIDLVVLVVAADDGVMPQTREHLAIMQLLGVNRGLVALTKVDIVEEELVELAIEDIREFLQGTFLEDASILPMSAVSGTGVDEFKERLFALATEIEPRASSGVFRMPVQRVFKKQGYGTILTGIPVSGKTRIGDVLEVQPGGQRGKVRGLQAYRETTEEACAGHSTAINLTDIDSNLVHRGAVVGTPGFFDSARMVGARLRALDGIPRPIQNRTAVRLHTGTAEVLGEVVLLDREELEAGVEGLVQLRLEEPVVCAPGDPFILRLASPSITLGGGVIVEESKYRLKRFKNFVLDELSQQTESLGSLSELLSVQLLRSRLHLSDIEQLAFSIKRSKQETKKLLEALREKELAWSNAAGDRWMHLSEMQSAGERVVKAASDWFEANPHRDVMDIADLRREFEWEPALFNAVLETQKEAGALTVEAGGRVGIAGRKVELDPETQALSEALMKVLEAGKLQPPTPEDAASKIGTNEARVRELLALQCDLGLVGRVGGDFFVAGSELQRASTAIVENCERNGQLVIPELRDVLGTTRKYLIPLLEYFDAQGLTLRQGGHRVLKRR